MQFSTAVVELVNHLEDAECRALWEWAQHVPVLRDCLFHIPNGGKRGKTEAARMKGIGVRAGVHDYHLPVPRGPFIGLWIEMKAGDNRPTTDQRSWGRRMVTQGHAVFYCWSWLAAKDVIEHYLLLPAPERSCSPISGDRWMMSAASDGGKIRCPLKS